jgi:hypothetical protein
LYPAVFELFSLLVDRGVGGIRMSKLKFILFAMLFAFLVTNSMAMMDPNEDLLNQAHRLSITTPAQDGTTVDKLLAQFGTDKVNALAKVPGLRFGKENKTLKALVDERLALHDTGSYSKFGLKGKVDNIGAFHKALDAAYSQGASSVGVDPTFMRFARDVLGLYSDCVLEDESGKIDADAISRDLTSGLGGVAAHLSSLGQKISKLEGERARLQKELEAEQLKGARRSSAGGSSRPGTVDLEEDGMPLFD